MASKSTSVKLPPKTSPIPGTKLQPPPSMPPSGDVLTKEFFLEMFKESREQNIEMFKEFREQNLEMLKEFKDEIRNEMEVLYDKFDTRVTKTNDNMMGIVNVITEYISGMEDNLETLNEAKTNLISKTEVVEQKIDNAEKQIIMIQYKQMELALRVRGLREEKQENLKQMFSEAFDRLVGKPGSNFDWQIDRIFRVNSWAAKQRQLP